jgi:hypothetical protein
MKTTATNYATAYQSYPLRHPQNKELRLHYGTSYKNAPVQTKRGPMVVEYMEALIETLKLHFSQYPKVFALRVDLYFPADWDESQRLSLDYYTRFMESLKAKLAAFNHRKAQVGDSRSNTVRFCRVYEQGIQRGLHIHALLLFNGHVFRGLGDYHSTQENLYHRINSAWASALAMHPVQVVSEGLVHFGETFYIERGQQDTPSQIKELFTRSAYICKADTKRFDVPFKIFSRSRG